MVDLLPYFIILPFLGFVLSLLVPKGNEKVLSYIAIGIVFLHTIGLAAFSAKWIFDAFPIVTIRHFTVFHSDDLEIFLDYYFDATTAVFAFVGSLIMLSVVVFSRFYLHRDKGFKLFFNVLLLFFFSYQLIVFAGNFETLFIGWELVGICSFLLISFYKDRYLPVKNSLKVLSIYRLGDICLMLAMSMSHHLWHENITFAQWNDLAVLDAHIAEHGILALFISLMLLTAASVKSAQLPFSSWLPRAMEGPTSSSAVFYGSLSVHIGVFLLLRTYPYWETLMPMRIIIVMVGVLTALVANQISKVHASVKVQIAYASITQIGIMFVEIGLGFHTLALIHFAGNSFLRTYQLLVSPSVLGYRIHDMFFNYIEVKKRTQSVLMQKISNTVYVLSLKEFNLDFFQYRLGWLPFKWIGSQLTFLKTKTALVLLVAVYILGLVDHNFKNIVPDSFYVFFSFIFSLIGLMLILLSFAERGSSVRALEMLLASQLFILLSICLANPHFGTEHIVLYLSGFLVSALVGYICLKKVEAIDNDIRLDSYHGYGYLKPRIAMIFFLSCLGLAGLPLTPSFVGIDLIFSHLHKEDDFFVATTVLNYVFLELALLRIYARIFLGPYKKNDHALAYKSS